MNRPAAFYWYRFFMGVFILAGCAMLVLFLHCAYKVYEQYPHLFEGSISDFWWSIGFTIILFGIARCMYGKSNLQTTRWGEKKSKFYSEKLYR